MWASDGLRRQVPADAAASDFRQGRRPPFPLLPDDGAQPSPGPLVKVAQHRRGLAEAEVAAPSDQVDGQLLDDLREAPASGAARQFPYPTSQPVEPSVFPPLPRVHPTREAEAQELALA